LRLAQACKLKSAMVRLPNRCSADGLLTLSHHCLFSIHVDQLDKADGMYTYLFGMQCLVTLWRLHEVHFSSLQHPRGPKTTCGFNGARTCIGPTQCWPKLSLPAYNAECRVAHTSYSPHLPPYHETLWFHLQQCLNVLLNHIRNKYHTTLCVLLSLFKKMTCLNKVGRLTHLPTYCFLYKPFKLSKSNIIFLIGPVRCLQCVPALLATCSVFHVTTPKHVVQTLSAM
jgi:hypothetical protein